MVAGKAHLAVRSIGQVHGRLSTAQLLAVSILWLALYAQWLTIVPIIVPDQVAGIVGSDNPRKEGITGTIVAAGAAMALFVAPLAGALSDRLRTARGRRAPFLVTGIIASCLSLALMGLFGPGSSIVVYALAFLNLQFWWNWAAGPYAGLIPDVVAPAEQARASGWMNAMSIVGTILGNLLVAALYRPGQLIAVIGAFIGLSLAALAATIRGVREPPGALAEGGIPRTSFFRSFYLDPREHRNFFWVLLTRLLANMGIWSVFTFLLFYVESVVGAARSDAARLVPALLGLGAVLAIPASLLGVRLAERFGPIRLVRITSWIMAAAAMGYVLIAIRPSLWLVVPLVLVFSAAYGAYGAVDWALALRVLPSFQDAGKDMGIWHISMVLPQIVGPAGTGWLITALKTGTSAAFAYAFAFAVAALWFTLAALLVGRIRLPPGPMPNEGRQD